jgi:hypothetical protein
LQVLIGLIVAPVMLDLLGQAHGLGGAVEVAGDDIPAHTTTGQVVQGRHASCEQIRRFVGQVGGQAKAEVFGDGSHRRNQQQRVVDRQLDGLFEWHINRLLIHVVDTHDVGDKQPVKQPALQQLRQFRPVLQGVEARSSCPVDGSTNRG